MIDNLLEAFKKSYEEYGDDFISDQHKLDEGLYIKISPEGIIESHIIRKDNENDSVDEIYKWFQKRDFISKYLESNKAVPTKPIKLVHSNNYLSWFVKKDTLIDTEKSLDLKTIIDMNESYYDSLLNKFNNNEVISLLEGDFSNEKFDFCKHFLVNRFEEIYQLIIENKENYTFYVKVFFDFDINIYQRESKRYLYHKIFNSDKYNIEVDSKIYGLSNFNMGLNSKKPYLEHKTMKRKTPFMVSLEKALLIYKYSLYLKNNGYGVKFQHTSEKLKHNLDKEIMKSYDCQNMLILSQDNGNSIIDDYDIISNYDEYSLYSTKNHLEYVFHDKESNRDVLKSYTSNTTNSKKILEDDINKFLFNLQLKSNYYKNAKDIKPSRFLSKSQIEILLQSRNMLFDYFYKGIDSNLKIFIDKFGLALLLESFETMKEEDSFNVYYSIKNYCKGEDKVSDIKEYKKRIKEIVESENDEYFANENEYSLAAGQLAYYILSCSNSNKKNHDAIQSFINRKTVGQLNDEIIYWFNRYAHDIGRNFRRFNRLYAAILAYDKSKIKMDDMFLAGYLSNNILYEKKEVIENGEEK